MPELNKYNDKLVFGLDIGTRSIVGSVGYMEKNRFHVIAHYVKEHETRAMLDGQIHDIGKVSETISKVKKELEMQVQAPLKDVCIAAAGRVLKTITVHIDYELPAEQQINNEHVYSLDLMGVEKAYDIIREEDTDIKFYCVGYTVIKYYLNDYMITNLEGHKAKKISADVLATFLPEDVVDGLYTAVEDADLNVANMTLEPIAAINIAIPQNYRLLNIALVDVGAGTSDISITKDGSIIAYGMIPHAGDELTETLVSRYLVDFNTAEKIKRASVLNKQITFKDIMGLKQKVSPQEVREIYTPTVETMTREIADKIIELNGGKSVSAVFVVGGGGKVSGFTSALARHLDIPEERVALRGAEVLMEIDFIKEGIKKDPLLVTPIGICLSFYDQKNNFIFVHINDERIKLYDNDKLTVTDAAMQIGFPNEDLFPKRGKELEFTMNGAKRMFRGLPGEPAVITINGEPANIHSKIMKNDRIYIKESTVGNAAEVTIDKLPEYKSSMTFIVNGQSVVCPCFVQVNGELKPGDYNISSGDTIEILNYYTVEQALQFLDIDYDSMKIRLNNRTALPGDLVYENFNLDFEEFPDKPEDASLQYEEYTEPEAESEQQKVSGEETAPENDTTINSAITVIINNTPVILKNKNRYIFVDILDFYPFDTSVAGGTELVTTINGERCDFTGVINNGDVLEIYWK